MGENSTPRSADLSDLAANDEVDTPDKIQAAVDATTELSDEEAQAELEETKEQVKDASQKEQERLAAALRAAEEREGVTDATKDSMAALRAQLSQTPQSNEKESSSSSTDKSEEKENDKNTDSPNDAIDTNEETEKKIANLTQQSSGFGATVDKVIEIGIAKIGPILSNIPFLKNIPGFSNLDPESLRKMAWSFLSKKPLGIPFVGGAVHALAKGKAELAGKQSLVAAEAKKLGVQVQLASQGAEELLRLKDSAIGDAVKTVVEALAKTDSKPRPIILTAQMLLDAPKIAQQAKQAEQQELLAARQKRLDEIKEATTKKTGKNIGSFAFGPKASAVKNGEEYVVTFTGSPDKIDTEENKILTELLAQISDENITNMSINDSPIRTLTKNGDSFALQIPVNGKSDVPELLASKDIMEKFALKKIQIGTDGSKRPLPPESFEATEDGTLIVSKAEELPKIRTDNVDEKIASAGGAGVYKLEGKQWKNIKDINSVNKSVDTKIADTDEKDSDDSAQQVA